MLTVFTVNHILSTLHNKHEVQGTHLINNAQTHHEDRLRKYTYSSGVFQFIYNNIRVLFPYV